MHGTANGNDDTFVVNVREEGNERTLAVAPDAARAIAVLATRCRLRWDVEALGDVPDDDRACIDAYFRTVRGHRAWIERQPPAP